MTRKIKLGVIGDPVKHSLSPKIHQQFAKQLAHQIDYQKYHVQAEDLPDFLTQFFAQGGRGLNVTLPHKQHVIQFLDHLSDEAKLTNSVNTLSIDEKGHLKGDTTDGQGLLLDLKQKGFQVSGKHILVIGAGGASLSVLAALLKAGAEVSLYNRTQGKIPDIINRFSSLGNIHHFSPNQTLDSKRNFDCVISSISQFNPELMESVKPMIGATTVCYDLNYGERARDFMDFAKVVGSELVYSGWGMLVAQAALSYQIWNGELPNLGEFKQEQLSKQ